MTSVASTTLIAKTASGIMPVTGWFIRFFGRASGAATKVDPNPCAIVPAMQAVAATPLTAQALNHQNDDADGDHADGSQPDHSLLPEAVSNV